MSATVLDLRAQLAQLRKTFASVLQVVDPEQLKKEADGLEQQAAAPGLWDNPEQAQQITSKLSHAKARLGRIGKTRQRLDDLDVMLQLVEEETDQAQRAELLADVEQETADLQTLMDEIEVQTLLNGEYDERGAVVTIRSGAGGVDAADFAEMLLRMYLRWSEKHGYPTTMLDTSYAEEAGIKSATFEVDEPYAYGTLSVEAGTHRLVRISPFNAAGKRQTSFAAVEVVPLVAATESIDIPDAEIRVDVFRASGPGGQSVNTTDSAVRITHIPTGITVSCQNEKSQIQNRAAALRVLQSRLLEKKRQEEEAVKRGLAGDIKASWGDQMRSYVIHPYQMVKDLRTGYEVNNPDKVFDGDLDGFINAGIRWRKQRTQG